MSLDFLSSVRGWVGGFGGIQGPDLVERQQSDGGGTAAKGPGGGGALSPAAPVAVELKTGKAGMSADRPPTGVVMSVIMPVYNEEATLPKTLDAVSAYAAEHPEVRFVIADDGSRDGSVELVRSRLGLIGGAEMGADGRLMGPGDARVVLLALTPNGGKGEVVRRAMRVVESPMLAFMDGDLAYLPEEHLPEMIEKLGRFDVVIGARHESFEERRNTKRLRRVMGWTFNKVVRAGLGLGFEDTQAGVKGFRREAAKAIFSRSRLSGFSFDVELLFVAKRLGLSVVEIPAKVARAHRKKPTKVNLATEPVRMLGDLGKVRWNWLRGRYK